MRQLQVLALAACVVTAAALGLHLRAASGGVYLNHVSGTWLALATDAAGGELYRPIEGPDGYGGTRHFPLFICVTAFFLRMGFGPAAAGGAASGVAGLLLLFGTYRLVRIRGGSLPLAVTFGAASISSYFVQQTLFELRGDVMAAALSVMVLALVADRTREANGTIGFAAPICLALAAATKVTVMPFALAVIAGIAVAGRSRQALSLLSAALVWLLVIAGTVHVASNGRALENWRAFMFAGESAGGVLSAVAGGAFLEAAGYSRLILLLCALAVLALAVAAWFVRNPGAIRKKLAVPVAAFAGVTVTAAVVLSSPGAVASNHLVEWIAVTLAVIGWIASVDSRLTRPLALTAVILVVGMSAQDVIRAVQMKRWETVSRPPEAVDALISRVASQDSPVLSDSPLWPVLARRPVYVLDAYAFRVIARARTGLESDLVSAVSSKRFPLIVLQQDPNTPAGHAYYEHLHFGRQVRDAILTAYRLDEQVLRDAFVFVPRH